MQRLTLYEREQIASLARQGQGVRDIGRQIGRDHSVVSRELTRNGTQLFAYEAASAQHYAERRAKKTNVRKLEKYPKLKDWVRKKLREKWSPEQISGRLKGRPPKDLKGLRVSHEAIYAWIYEASPKGEPWLYHHLRRKRPDRQKHYARKKRSQKKIKELVPISERPETAGLGHFEADSMLGRRGTGGLSVHYERSSQWVKLHPIETMKAEETKDALQATVEDLPPGFVKTLTFDRGGETALHHELREPYSLMTFHCDPYCPWQKGGVEQANGLLRQFFPKGTGFRQVTSEQIAEAEELLNDRPRKKLGYKTPNEVLGGALNT